jgi:hypothetical protein
MFASALTRVVRPREVRRFSGASLNPYRPTVKQYVVPSKPKLIDGSRRAGRGVSKKNLDLRYWMAYLSVRACQTAILTRIYRTLMRNSLQFDLYLDESGEVRDVGSGEHNDYLRENSGADFTAKDFLTCAGTQHAAQALQDFQDFDTTAAAKRNNTKEIEHVAERYPGEASILCVIEPTSEPPPQELREAAAALLTRLGPQLRCVAFVIEGSGFRAAMIRGVLSGIEFLRRSTYPTRYFAEVGRAAAWVASEMCCGS